MEKLIQLINYRSCLPQHQSADPLAPATRANRKGIFNYSRALHLPFATPGSAQGEFLFFFSLAGARGKSMGATRLWEKLDPTWALHLAQGEEHTVLLPALLMLLGVYLLGNSEMRGKRGWGRLVRMAARVYHICSLELLKHGAVNESLGSRSTHALLLPELPDSNPCSGTNAQGLFQACSQCCCCHSFYKKKKIKKLLNRWSSAEGTDLFMEHTFLSPDQIYSALSSKYVHLKTP